MNDFTKKLAILALLISSSASLLGMNRKMYTQNDYNNYVLTYTYADDLLMAAVMSNDINGIYEALRSGAQINRLVQIGSLRRTITNLLYLALFKKNPHTFRHLLQNGIDASTDDSFGRSVTNLILENDLTDKKVRVKDVTDGRLLYIKPLYLYGGCNTINMNGETTLHTAVRVKDIDVVKFLLYKGFDPNTKRNDGLTPLDSAKNYESEELIQLLEEHSPTNIQEKKNMQNYKDFFDTNLIYHK